MWRASLSVWTIRLFGDDSFESHSGHLLEECFALALDVIEIPQWTERWNYVLEELLPPQELERTHVEVLKSKEIERIESCGQLHGSAANLQRRRETTTL